MNNKYVLEFFFGHLDHRILDTYIFQEDHQLTLTLGIMYLMYCMDFSLEIL